MTNLLSAPVEIFTFPPRIVWYEPEGFPGVETDAELVSSEGDALTVFKGWGYEIISAAQVKRIVMVRSAESTELLDEERADYDAETKS